MMAKRSQGRAERAPILAKLDDLKRLAILRLLASGVQSSQIAKALGVHSSVISRMMPAREIKKLATRRIREP
jgi:IS30 family transposase